MNTQIATIRTLLRTHFTGDSPLWVADHEHAAVSETIRQRLAGLSYVAHDDGVQQKKSRILSAHPGSICPKGRFGRILAAR